VGIETNKIGVDFVDFFFVNRKRFVNTSKRYAHAKGWLKKSAHGPVIHLSDHIKQIFAVFFSLENLVLISNKEVAADRNEMNAAGGLMRKDSLIKVHKDMSYI
jgi:hypothetical protein